jgi:hypothetical protein
MYPEFHSHSLSSLSLIKEDFCIGSRAVVRLKKKLEMWEKLGDSYQLAATLSRQC